MDAGRGNAEAAVAKTDSSGRGVICGKVAGRADQLIDGPMREIGAQILRRSHGEEALPYVAPVGIPEICRKVDNARGRTTTEGKTSLRRTTTTATRKCHNFYDMMV